MCLYKNPKSIGWLFMSSKDRKVRIQTIQDPTLKQCKYTQLNYSCLCIQFQEFTLAKLISVNCPKGKNLPETFRVQWSFLARELRFPSEMENATMQSLGKDHGKHSLTVVTGLWRLGPFSERDHNCISRHPGALHILGLPDRTCSGKDLNIANFFQVQTELRNIQFVSLLGRNHA